MLWVYEGSVFVNWVESPNYVISATFSHPIYNTLFVKLCALQWKFNTQLYVNHLNKIGKKTNLTPAFKNAFLCIFLFFSVCRYALLN